MPPSALPATHFLALTPTIRPHLLRLRIPTLLDILSTAIKTSPPIPLPPTDEAISSEEAQEQIEALRNNAKIKKAEILAFVEESLWGEQVPVSVVTQALLHATVEKDRIHWGVGMGVKVRGGDGTGRPKREEPVESHKIAVKEVMKEMSEACRGVVGRWFIDSLRYPEEEGPPLTMFIVLGYPTPTPTTLRELTPPRFTTYYALADTAPLVFLSTAVGSNFPFIARDDDTSRTAAESFLRAVRLGIVRILERNTGKDGIEVRTTSLLGKNLKVLWSMRGETGHAARGAWSIYSGKEKEGLEKGPLGGGKDAEGDIEMGDQEEEDPAVLAAKAVEGRFGIEGLGAKGLDRVVYALEEEWDPGWTPRVTISMEGSHVWRGARKWVEDGILDVEKCPAWFTGEAGVTTGVVKNGSVKGRLQI